MSGPSAGVVEPPHILMVTLSGAALVCPYTPPTLAMPCAALMPCFCEVDIVDGDGLCPVSPGGEHEYVAGLDGLYYLAAECWAVGYADLADALPASPLSVGRFEVWPVGEDDGRLTLVWTAPRPGRP